MAIHQTIKQQIPEALRVHDEVRLRTLRSLFAAMTNEAIAKHANPADILTFSERMAITHDRFLTDQEALVVIRRAAKQRKDSIEQFEKAGRTDLAKNEKDELAVIEIYLPQLMTREQIGSAARTIIQERGFSVRADRSSLMAAFMQKFKGQADGSDVKAVADALLA